MRNCALGVQPIIVGGIQNIPLRHIAISNVTAAGNEKRKQGQSPAPMRSQSTGHLRLLFFWSGCEFFAPPVFLPQTWTATTGAQYYCADALHSADKLLIPYSGPICHQGCRALHHKASKPEVARGAVPVFPRGTFVRSPAALVIDGAIRFHCDLVFEESRGAHATVPIFSADPA
jgi:hypothetical protein